LKLGQSFVIISGGEETAITGRYRGGWKGLPAFLFLLIVFVTMRR